MNTEIIFIDIDGTLLNSDKIITSKTIDSIKKVLNKNIKIVLCTGRDAVDTEMFSSKCGIKDYYISSTGGFIYDIKKDYVIYKNEINKKYVKLLYNYSNDNNMRVILHSGTKRYVNIIRHKNKEILIKDIDEFLDNNYVTQIIMVSNNFEYMKKLKKYFEKNCSELIIINESKQITNNDLSYKGYLYYDIVNSNTNKGNSVKEICKYLNIPLENTIFIGDSTNDLSAFSVVGLSIAMGNAEKEIKNKAKLIIQSNDLDGISNFLNEFYTKISSNKK